MNVRTIFKKNKIFNIYPFYSLILVFYFFLWLENVMPLKYSYTFEINEKDSEILFFAGQKAENICNEQLCNEHESIFNIRFTPKSHSEKHSDFIYRKDNFIQFEVLNNLSASNKSEIESKYGIIECGYELFYYLKLSKEITEIPDKINTDQFKYMLMTLKFLGAMETKKIVKLFQALIMKAFFNQNTNNRRNECLDFAEVFSPNFSATLNFSLKKNFILAFLNFFVLKCEFYIGNLILYADTKKEIEIHHFDENIPYKNLLINNFKVFFSLENILENPYALKTFKVILNEINIKSLIINENHGFTIPNYGFQFTILSIDIFKSITLKNFYCFSPMFSSKLNYAIEKNLEFLTLKDIQVDVCVYDSIMKSQKLKGLIIFNVDTTYLNRIARNMQYKNDLLKFIDFNSVRIDYTLWKIFFERASISKIIITLNIFIAESFINAFIECNLIDCLLYLDICFNFCKVKPSFLYSLSNFRNLKTLKLAKYEVDGIVGMHGMHLYTSIQGLENLEHLKLDQYPKNKKFYNFLLKKPKVKILCLENIFFDAGTSLIDFFRNNKQLTKLFMREININSSCLREIFGLENLIELTIKFCDLKFITACEDFNLETKNINCLNLFFKRSNSIKNIRIIGNQDFLESLKLLNCGFQPGYLSKLSSGCNKILKILVYGNSVINIIDLKRIEKFEILEELNFSNSELFNCCFYDLGENCRFFNSLKYLYIDSVKLNTDDLKYLKNFRNLKILCLVLPDMNLLTIKNFITSLPIIILIKFNAQTEKDDKFRTYLFEHSISFS